jgi:hypothetical protein
MHNQLLGIGIGVSRSKEGAEALDSTQIRYGGIRALMLAVFEDGVRCFLGRSPILAAEAEAWIFARSSTNPFSFPILCEVLGLDPSATRDALLLLRERAAAGQAKLPRARHNVRSVSRVRPRRIRSRKRRLAALS